VHEGISREHFNFRFRQDWHAGISSSPSTEAEPSLPRFGTYELWSAVLSITRLSVLSLLLLLCSLLPENPRVTLGGAARGQTDKLLTQYAAVTTDQAGFKSLGRRSMRTFILPGSGSSVQPLLVLGVPTDDASRCFDARK
jgi:hypothetical protein